MFNVATWPSSVDCLSPLSPMAFTHLNELSLSSKLVDLLSIHRDRINDVFCVAETWHDADSVHFHRLRFDGFNFVDRPRPLRT
jgi:hypothetical protein